MANSGSLTTTSSQNRSLTFNWNVASQNIQTNQTTINWSLIGSGSSTGWVNCGNFKVLIDGKQVYYSSTRIKVYQNTKIASGSYTFTHDSSGNKSFVAYVEAGIYQVAVNCSGQKTFTLPTINRLTQLNSFNGTDINSNVSVRYTSYNSNVVNNLRISIQNGSTLQTINNYSNGSSFKLNS